MENNQKMSRGITLIALVVTIIVLLILAGISIAMLSGNNGILTKSTDAKNLTGKSNIIEQAKTDILEQIVKNKGETITEIQLKTILGKYFEEFNDELTDDLSNTNITLTAKNAYGGYTNIPLYEIYNGKLKKEKKVVTPTDIYVALYNDGTLVFSNNSDDIDTSNIKTNYGNIRETNYMLYYNNLNEVTNVNILNEIVPTSCAGWFCNCTSLRTIANIENLNTSCVTDMSYMFATCGQLSVNVSSFDTSQVTKMDFMFGNAINDDFGGTGDFTGLENFNMENVTTMQGMFYFDSCYSNSHKISDIYNLCINANSIPSENKTLRYVAVVNRPLNESEFNILQSVSNYQNFIEAGWTIGY